MAHIPRDRQCPVLNTLSSHLQSRLTLAGLWTWPVDGAALIQTSVVVPCGCGCGQAAPPWRLSRPLRGEGTPHGAQGTRGMSGLLRRLRGRSELLGEGSRRQSGDPGRPPPSRPE